MHMLLLCLLSSVNMFVNMHSDTDPYVNKQINK